LGTKLGSAAAAGLAPLAAVRTALAHGGVVGPQDWMQDYGGTIFLAAAVVAGGAVVVWLLRTPVQSDDDVSDSSSGAHKEPERAT
jgi:nicotinamide mononucleotide (NMN) deamidase PncC